MATYTENLNLKKPDLTDPASIGDINSNMDIIDETIGGLLVTTRELVGSIPNTASKQYSSLSKTFTKDGYKPIALVGFYHDSRYFTDKYEMKSKTDTSITIGGYSTNWDSASHIGVSVYAHILWQKI